VINTFKTSQQFNSANAYLIILLFFSLITYFWSEAQAKDKASFQKSSFQISYEKALQNKKTAFDFIDQKGNKRMYVIEKNGVINEIKSYEDSFSQKSTSQKRKVKKRSLSPQSSFELAWNNAIRKGLKTFQFTDQKRKL